MSITGKRNNSLIVIGSAKLKLKLSEHLKKVLIMYDLNILSSCCLLISKSVKTVVEEVLGVVPFVQTHLVQQFLVHMIFVHTQFGPTLFMSKNISSTMFWATNI